MNSKGDIKLPYQFTIIEILKYMGGWSYQDYLEQPKWLLEYIIFKMELESIKIKKKDGRK